MWLVSVSAHKGAVSMQGAYSAETQDTRHVGTQLGGRRHQGLEDQAPCQMLEDKESDETWREGFFLNTLSREGVCCPELRARQK